MENHAEEVLAALELGQMAVAETALAASLASDSDDLIYSLAEALQASGYRDFAKQAYQKLLADYPTEGSVLTALADLAIDDDQLDLAQEYLATVGSDNPAYLQVLLVKADLYQEEGLTESAEHCLLEASRLAPDEPIVRFALGEFYFANGQYRPAISAYRALLLQGQRKMADIDLVARIGSAYAAIGKIDQAVGYLEQIKDFEQTTDTKFELAFLYVEQGDDEQAEPLFREVLAADPQYTSIYPLLGQLYERANRKHEALKTYQIGLSYDQTNPLLYRLAGLQAFQQGEDALAKGYYEKALILDDQDLASYLALVDLYLAQHDYEQVLATIQAAEAEELVDPQFNWARARAYHALEKEEQAAQYWTAAQADYADNADFYHDLADWYHETAASLAKERQALQRAVALDPSNQELQDRLAMIEE
ncbi:tetratricopeptide repeat protein [Leuconostocaceae bacterium ESL0958]|nr:tetratricopeptide repeat protein [Leuconostocaceae bacterium ESL0958]